MPIYFNPTKIYDLLCRKIAKDPEFKSFAAHNHRYELHPKLSIEILRGIEADNEINLPNEYVEFITEIGNGGAGPGYGIIPLEKSINTSNLDYFYYAQKNFLCHTFHPPSNSNEAQSVKHGLLKLCDYGCDEFDLLAINGSAKGTVWRFVNYHFFVGYHPILSIQKNGVKWPQELNQPISLEEEVDIMNKYVNSLCSRPASEHMKFPEWYTTWLDS